MYVRKNRPRHGPVASDAHSRTCSVRRAFALAMHMQLPARGSHIHRLKVQRRARELLQAAAGSAGRGSGPIPTEVARGSRTSTPPRAFAGRAACAACTEHELRVGASRLRDAPLAYVKARAEGAALAVFTARSERLPTRSRPPSTFACPRALSTGRASVVQELEGGGGIRPQGAEALGLAVVDADAAGAGGPSFNAAQRSRAGGCDVRALKAPQGRDRLTPAGARDNGIAQQYTSAPRGAGGGALHRPQRLRMGQLYVTAHAPAGLRRARRVVLASACESEAQAWPNVERVRSTLRRKPRAQRRPRMRTLWSVQGYDAARCIHGRLHGRGQRSAAAGVTLARLPFLRANVETVHTLAGTRDLRVAAAGCECSTMIRRWGAAVQCSGRERGTDLRARELAQRRAGRRVRGALHRKPRAHNAPRMRGHLCARGMRCSTCPARRANLCAEARIAGAYDVRAVARESERKVRTVNEVVAPTPANCPRALGLSAILATAAYTRHPSGEFSPCDGRRGGWRRLTARRGAVRVVVVATCRGRARVACKDARACCVVFFGVVGEGDEEEEAGRQPSRDQRRRQARKQPARGRDRSHAFR
ncbi:hypothetical protein FB451DRAFT_1441192 [Mycena latifolia]|nr:hypothetical protein FB451DRAFT_1441187 [Mycena latifolia]KAJ7441416.1 hypothetical protein FB451DRAFT_1441192 [Mycena latifolia]